MSKTPLSYTVAFSGHPGNINGNPFDYVTDFGAVETIGIGDMFKVADIFREALEQIAREPYHAGNIAQDALDKADEVRRMP